MLCTTAVILLYLSAFVSLLACSDVFEGTLPAGIQLIHFYILLL